MKKIQAGFELLYFLSAVDGKVDESEIKVILHFIVSNFGDVDFDPAEVAESLNSSTKDMLAQELERAAQTFYENTSSQERIKFLDSALSLIAADGKVTTEESKFLLLLGGIWNIDMKEYLIQKLNF